MRRDKNLPETYKNLYGEGKDDRGGSASLKEIKPRSKECLSLCSSHSTDAVFYRTRKQVQEHALKCSQQFKILVCKHGSLLWSNLISGWTIYQNFLNKIFCSMHFLFYEDKDRVITKKSLNIKILNMGIFCKFCKLPNLTQKTFFFTPIQYKTALHTVHIYLHKY